MAISKDVFLSILAMDSYNRGYGAGISDAGDSDPDGLGETKNVSTVGTAIVSYTITDADLSNEAQASGFYAIAYTVGGGVEGLAAGTTVISYRGTDAGWDYLKGWAVGGGLTTEWTQADEALTVSLPTLAAPGVASLGDTHFTVSASNDFELAETLKRAA